MKFLACLALVLAVAGCNSLPNEVVPLRDGQLRASTWFQADAYCRKKGATLHTLGNAPAQEGVLFRCD